MFTPSMTDAELQAVAYQDYLEIRMKVKLAFEKFVQAIKLQSGQRRAIHSLVETKTIRTKSRNTWNVNFRNTGYDPNGKIFCVYHIYIPLYRNDQVDYLFMNDFYGFRLERISAHFLQRYKERYLDYKKINLRGMSPVIYYMMNNEDRRRTYYLPKTWTEEEMQEKCFLISSQGLSLIGIHDKVLAYITFLDQENLSRYKSMVYEEEMMWKDLELIASLSKNTADNLLPRQALYKKVFDNPNSRKIMERLFHRIDMLSANKDEEKMLDNVDKLWNEMFNDSEWFHKRWKEVMNEVRPKTLMDAQLEDRSLSLHGRC